MTWPIAHIPRCLKSTCGILVTTLVATACTDDTETGPEVFSPGATDAMAPDANVPDALATDAGNGVDAPRDASEELPVEAGTTDTASPWPDATEPPPLPGGRKNFVFSLMGAIYNGAWARIGTWVFAGDGTVAESYWRWDQTETPTPPNVLTERAETGHTTAGCPKVCTIWTAKDFEPGAPPATRTGSWNFTSNGDVHILWPDGRNEYYTIVDHGSYVQLRLLTHNHPGVSTVYASVFGSHADITQGVGIDEIKAVGNVVASFHSQNWDAVTTSETVTLRFTQYHRCTASHSIQGINPNVYHTYFAGDPTSDGRKTYWYSQLASVAHSVECAQIMRGGHTNQLLQIIDDEGTFIGWVGAEASLLGRYHGGSIITHVELIHQ